MEWTQYLAAFWAGAFFCNFVPHFVHGVSGNKFPSVFSNPRGIGLSSPPVNIAWAFFNLLVAFALFMQAPIDRAHPLLILTFITGMAALSTYASFRFQRKHKE